VGADPTIAASTTRPASTNSGQVPFTMGCARCAPPGIPEMVYHEEQAGPGRDLHTPRAHARQAADNQMKLGNAVRRGSPWATAPALRPNRSLTFGNGAHVL
jgi:hypothetical protein